MKSTDNWWCPYAFPNPIAGGEAAVRADVAADESATDVNAASGFPAIYSKPVEDGGKFVSRADLNGLLYAASAHGFYERAGGLNTWDSAFMQTIGGYPKGAVVAKVYEAHIAYYKSLVEDNKAEIADFQTTKSWQYLSYSGGTIFDAGSSWEFSASAEKVVGTTTQCTVSSYAATSSWLLSVGKTGLGAVRAPVAGTLVSLGGSYEGGDQLLYETTASLPTTTANNQTRWNVKGLGCAVTATVNGANEAIVDIVANCVTVYHKFYQSGTSGGSAVGTSTQGADTITAGSLCTVKKGDIIATYVRCGSNVAGAGSVAYTNFHWNFAILPSE